MIETILIDYLSSEIGVSVTAERPRARQGEYLVIDKTGSSESDHLESAMVAVQCFADTKASAASLCSRVKKAMRSIADKRGDVTRSSLNSDYDNTDTSTKKYMYQALFDITFYEMEE